jgi:hypothetical protein
MVAVARLPHRSAGERRGPAESFAVGLGLEIRHVAVSDRVWSRNSIAAKSRGLPVVEVEHPAQPAVLGVEPSLPP